MRAVALFCLRPVFQNLHQAASRASGNVSQSTGLLRGPPVPLPPQCVRAARLVISGCGAPRLFLGVAGFPRRDSKLPEAGK